MRKRPGFSEADLQLMFRHLQKRWHPDYSDDEVRDLFEIWRDYYAARRGVERQALIDRMPELLPLLADAEIVAILETAADAAEAQAALRILDASDDKGGSLERAGFRKLGIEGPSPAARPSGSKRSDGASISIRRRSNECLY
jgi:hypothetical protein